MSNKKCRTLTPEQREFCIIRFKNPNLSGAECVHRAYPGRFKSDNSAGAHASRLLNLVKVQEYFEQLSRRMENRIGVAIGRILAEEANLAFFDPGELIDPNTRETKPIDRVPEHLRRAILGVKIIHTQSLKDPDIVRTEYQYKFMDKGRALERLEKHLGMFLKDNEQKPTEKTIERWFAVPTDKHLTLAEWTAQVEELDKQEAARKAAEDKANDKAGSP